MSTVCVVAVGSRSDGSMDVVTFAGLTAKLDTGYAFLKLDFPTTPTGIGHELDVVEYDTSDDRYFLMRVAVTPTGFVWRDRDGATDYYLELERPAVDEETLTLTPVTVYDTVRIGDKVSVVSAGLMVHAYVEQVLGSVRLTDAKRIKGRVREAIVCV